MPIGMKTRLLLPLCALVLIGAGCKPPPECVEWKYKESYKITYPDGSHGQAYEADYCAKYAE